MDPVFGLPIRLTFAFSLGRIILVSSFASRSEFLLNRFGERLAVNSIPLRDQRQVIPKFLNAEQLADRVLFRRLPRLHTAPFELRDDSVCERIIRGNCSHKLNMNLVKVSFER